MKIFIYILTLLCLSSFIEIPKNHLKKIDKEVFSLFEIDNYEKVLVEIDSSSVLAMSKSFDPNGFFKIVKDQTLLGFFYFGKAPSKTDVFDYVVIFDEALIVKKIKILAYREDQGGEISSKRWLKQFNGLTQSDELQYGKDIKGISGATISAKSLTYAINNLMKDLAKLQY